MSINENISNYLPSKNNLDLNNKKNLIKTKSKMETLEYFVESIVEKRVKFGKVEYLLKWKGFSE